MSELWRDQRSAEETVRGVLLDPSQWIDVATAALGQLWYTTVSSFGLAIIGAIVLATACLRPRPIGERRAALTLGTMFVSTLVVSSLFMASVVQLASTGARGDLTVPRWDHMAYGRYIDAVVLLLSVAGITAVLRSEPGRTRRRLAASGSVAVLLCLGFLARWRDATLGEAVVPNTAGIAAIGLEMGPAEVAVATGIALVIMALIGIASGFGRTAIASLTVAIMVTSGFMGAVVAVSTHHLHSYARMYEDVPPPEDRRVVVVPDDARQDRALELNWYGQQFVLAPLNWSFEFVEDDSAAIAGSLGPDVGLVALINGTTPAGFETSWRPVGGGGDVTLWLRK